MKPLKSCPFCNSNKLEIVKTHGTAISGYEYWVVCNKCGAGGGLRTRLVNARKCWNKRKRIISVDKLT